MLDKPNGCLDCPLMSLSTGFMQASLAANPYGVTLIGEALGGQEVDDGLPFRGAAGFKFSRMVEFAGLDRERFDIINSVWCRPPNGKLDGETYEASAISHCRTNHWDHLLARSSVLVPMGNVATGAVLGRKGILALRGYIYGKNGHHIVPTVHPSFIQRGQSKYSAALIHDLQKAVELATNGPVYEPTEYTLDPTPGVAYQWAKDYITELANGRARYLAFDIETPGKGDDEEELDGENDQTYHIFRIGFSYRGLHALTVPWAVEYMPAIRLLLGSAGDKVVWNASFDVPRVRAGGVDINGLVHDGMVAWHILHSDLPKGLGFVATFTCPHQHEWKSMSHRAPALYNAIDACVELRSMEKIEEELITTGLWPVYDRDVLQIEPILQFMSTEGMPIDAEIRLDRAQRLAEKAKEKLDGMEALIPREARRLDPPAGFVRPPADTSGLVTTRVDLHVSRCDRCGLANPLKPHFKTLKRPTAKRPQNPCAGAGIVTEVEAVERFARLEEFKPSREQLIRYQLVLGRNIPRKRDKKSGEMRPTMDEKAIKKLLIKYPDDKVYESVLDYRSINKLQGTYIGYPREDAPREL